MSENEAIDQFLKELSKNKYIDVVKAFQIFKNVEGEDKYKYPEHILRMLKEQEIVGTKNGTVFYMLPRGEEIINSYGEWTNYLDAIDQRESQKERKEKLDLKLTEWKAKTFWWLFLLSIIGGISGIISLIMQLIR